jgi:hypothetical protein
MSHEKKRAYFYSMIVFLVHIYLVLPMARLNVYGIFFTGFGFETAYSGDFQHNSRL